VRASPYGSLIYSLITHSQLNTRKTSEREKYNKVKKLFSQLSETFHDSIKQVSAQLKLTETVRIFIDAKVFH
jgi:hypothetical protein